MRPRARRAGRIPPAARQSPGRDRPGRLDATWKSDAMADNIKRPLPTLLPFPSTDRSEERRGEAGRDRDAHHSSDERSRARVDCSLGEGMEMMEEATADLRELVRLPDVLVVCSSAGWTDQKHMLYLSLLEESFVSQLHDGEISFKGLFNHSPRASRPKQSSKRSVKNTEANQGYQKPWIKVEQIRSPSCENQEDGKVQSMDDNASATESQEASSHARATSSGQSSTCHFGKHKYSPSRSAEGSDQNFVDEEAKEKGESRRRCSNKRLKSADSMMDDQVVPSVKAELQQVGCLNARGKGSDDRDGASGVDVGLPDAEPGPSSRKGHEPKKKRFASTECSLGLTNALT